MRVRLRLMFVALASAAAGAAADAFARPAWEKCRRNWSAVSITDVAM